MIRSFRIQLKPDAIENLRELSIIRAARELSDDIDAIIERDPAAISRTEVLLLYSGLHALIFYRFAHALEEKQHPLAARFVSQAAKFLTGIEIHPGATIGRGLFIDHGAGVVIGETAVIGDNYTIYQGATLGGTGKDTGKRHPTLGNNVMVGAGAKLLGAFTVGDNAKIASGAVVLSDVPANSTAVGIPAKVVRREGVRVDATDLDQVHIPDPIAQELDALREKIAALEEAVRRYEEDAGKVPAAKPAAKPTAKPTAKSAVKSAAKPAAKSTAAPKKPSGEASE